MCPAGAAPGSAPADLRRPAAAACSSQSQLEGGEDALDAVAHVLAREGGAADVLDVLVELQGVAILLADELGAPLGIADFAAMGFAVVDDFVLANASVDDEPADSLAAGFGAPDLEQRIAHAHAAGLLDSFLQRRRD